MTNTKTVEAGEQKRTAQDYRKDRCYMAAAYVEECEREQKQAFLKVIESRLSDGSKVHGVSIVSWENEIVIDCASEKHAVNLHSELTAAIIKAEGRAQ